MGDDLFGAGSFLGGILGLGRDGGGSTPGWGSIGGTGGNVPQAGPQMGPQVGPPPGPAPAPASGAPGAPLDISAQAQGSPGILGQIASRLGLGGQQPGGAPAAGGQTPQQKAAGLAQNYLKPKPIQPAQFAPMQMAGPIPGPQSIV